MGFAELLSEGAFLNPILHPSIQVLIRFAGSALELIFFTLIIGQNWRLFFRSTEENGYVLENAPLQFLYKNKTSNLIFAVWFFSLFLTIEGQYSVIGSFVNLILCHHYFIRLRWAGLGRGLGAPGFMTFWLAGLIFALEATARYFPSLRSLTILAFQIDFAIIMFSAGFYKMTAGYIQNNGMELGLVNPMWGYWHKLYNKFSPRSLYIRFLNQMAWLGEIIPAFLMLYPATRFIGGLSIAFAFVFIATQIRLGVLCWQVITCAFIFFHFDLPFEVLNKFATTPHLWIEESSYIFNAIKYLIIFYIIARPVSLLALYYNFYAQKRLPNTLQYLLEKYTNFFGIILWRVFTVDVVNFYVMVYKSDGKAEVLLSDYSNPNNFRFNQVIESITVTTIFTTLKYFPNNSDLFKSKLITYSKSLTNLLKFNEKLIYKYYLIEKSKSNFSSKLIAEYEIDNTFSDLKVRILDKNEVPGQAKTIQSAHECSAPGSYAPVPQQ